MIALKLVFQSLAGVAAVGSVASGGYYMFNIGEDQYYLVSVSETTNGPTKELFTDEPAKTSSLNKATASSLFFTTLATNPSSSEAGKPAAVAIPATNGTQSESSQPASTLPVVLQKEKTQNYTCKSQDQKTEDKECKLFSIAFDTTNKSIDLATINTFIKAQAEGKTKDTDKITKTINKSELTSKHFFILKASSAFVDHQMFEGKKTITLASTAKDATDKDKSYAKLTVLANFKDEKTIGKTNVAVVIATAVDTVSTNLTIPTDNSKTYTCTLQNVKKTELKACSIQLLTSFENSSTFNFSSTTIATTQAALTIEKNKYYLIKWTEAEKFSHLEKEIYFDIKPAQPTTTSAVGTTTTPKKQTIFSPISRLIVHPTSSSPFSEVIIINK